MTAARASIVSSTSRLGEVVAAVRDARVMALDTEFMRERTYRARLCLVQVAAPRGIYVIDPLQDVDLGTLAELVAAPDVEVVVHAGSQDLGIFFETFGTVPQRVFDVQIAAGFVGLGASLPYGRLVEETVGATLVKGESYTDWCKRPLREAQLTYAADDVRYLLQVAERLKKDLEGRGRMAWAEQEMAAFEDPALYDNDPAQAWRRVSGRGSLSPSQIAVLAEVARWREETAAKRDIPRGWVVKDVSLVEIARRRPSSMNDLRQIRGLHGNEVVRSGEAILEAVERGRQRPPIELGRAPGREVQARARMLSSLADAIVRARCEGAGIAAELVATRSELEALLVAFIAGDLQPERHRLLKGWRRDLAGDPVLALAEGRVAVRATDRPPFVEEVVL